MRSCRARLRTLRRMKSARSGPMLRAMSSSASIHSCVSCGSRSGSWRLKLSRSTRGSFSNSSSSGDGFSRLMSVLISGFVPLRRRGCRPRRLDAVRGVRLGRPCPHAQPHILARQTFAANRDPEGPWRAAPLELPRVEGLPRLEASRPLGGLGILTYPGHPFSFEESPMSVAAIPVTTLYPARTGSRPLTAEDLWALPRVGSPVPGPDGTWCVVPVTTYDLEKNEGRTRLWRIPAGGGEPLALTSAELSSTDPAVSPDGRRLAFCRKAAAGKPQLYMMPLDGGEPRKLTELPLGVFDPRFMPDGTGIVFAAPLIKGHLTPEATAAEIERRDKDPVKAHVTEERLYRFWDQWLTTGEVPH